MLKLGKMVFGFFVKGIIPFGHQQVVTTLILLLLLSSTLVECQQTVAVEEEAEETTTLLPDQQALAFGFLYSKELRVRAENMKKAWLIDFEMNIKSSIDRGLDVHFKYILNEDSSFLWNIITDFKISTFDIIYSSPSSSRGNSKKGNNGRSLWILGRCLHHGLHLPAHGESNLCLCVSVSLCLCAIMSSFFFTESNME